ncbi:MAG: HNH endonuclease [Bacteroidales bacterium]|nr:HNH endonuclease [Bacteroidales bacterium]
MKKYSIEDVKKAVRKSKSIAGVLRLLGLRPVGGNYKTIHRMIDENHLDTSHFTGQGWNVGLQFKPKGIITNESIFVENSAYRCSWRLRERYKQVTGISSCESCNLSRWLNRDIPLEIHHINGINTDNRLENLQLLCPNCHALTDNYRGRAHLSALSERRDVECRKFKEALTGNADGNLEPSLQ